MTAQMMQFVTGLRSRNEETRQKAARELQHHVTTELMEMCVEDVQGFMDFFNHHIFEMVSSSDSNDKKGGILAIVSLLGVNVGNTSTRISRFANYLRNLLPSNDIGVMELAAYAVGRLALSSGTYTAEYVEFQVKRAFEWLAGERHEGKRHAAVLILKELAVSTPTLFFQQVQQFFDCIFNAVRDPKCVIREGAVLALRAALMVTAQRETKETQNPFWYKQCYEEAEKGFEELSVREKGVNRDDRVHGSLLIINELLRCSNIEGERVRQDLEKLFQQQATHEAHSHRYQLLKDLGSGSLTRSFRALHQLHHHQHLTPQRNIGLSAVIQYHKAAGIFPGTTSHSHILPLYESSICKMLMVEKFDQIPFYHFSYLNETMSYFLHCLRRERERYSAFIAIGLLAVAVGESIKPHIPKIMDCIRMSLPLKDASSKKKMPTADPAVFICISMLAQAVGLTVKNDIKDLLEPMMSGGLSPALTAALHELARRIPQLKKDIQDGLLKMLCNVLIKQPQRSQTATKIPTSTSLSGSLISPTESTDVASTTLALRTLGSFDFQGRSLMQHVRHCAECYLASEHKDIRLEAVRTCCRLLSPALRNMKENGRYSATLMHTVQDVLTKLLVVGVTDADPDVRYCVLASLDERFDGHLAQAENLNALFVCLNDEVFEIRELALCTIGRLRDINPAYVMPSLRKVLIQILTELEHSGVGRNKEQSAKMLGHLVANAPRLIRPYMEPVLKVLIPKLKDQDPNPGVVINVLAAIGEQAQVSGTEMRKWLDELMPIILDMLQDSSSLAKREVGLWTLGRLVESTGYVVEPYGKFPSLLDVLLNFLKTEQTSGIRREAIRVLGLLGALDPYKHKVNLGLIDHSGESGAVLSMSDSSQDSQELTASEMLVNMSSSLDEFYPAITIATLMRIIRDSSLFQHHTMVVHAVTFIFKSLGIRCVPYVPQVMPSFINFIRTSDGTIREFLFQQLGQMIAFVKQHIRNYLDDIFDLIKEFWTTNSTMQNTIILLVEQIVLALGAEFKIYLPQLIPHFLRVLMHDVSNHRIVTEKLLIALQNFGSNLDDYLHLILPPIVKLFDSTDAPMNVRK
ncbi:serine/threonine-protein kinase mTOR-like [Limulus polyphemus]|uniref:Serine/threonine-protein kinase TOR n=1 Tax=Limulus polyphemus TaxID=6850 RepID=A0ABM1BB57_LIMPO|nr:serine/threonine-protein kinase mTOR-like [Limulus polyphemus]